MKIIDLIKRAITGIASREQKDDIDQFLVESFQSENWDHEEYGNREEVKDRIVSKVTDSIARKERNIRSSRLWILTKAASILLFIGLASYWGITIFTSPDDVIDQTIVLAPGSDKAILELSDGTILNLSDQKIGETRVYGNSLVKKMEEGNIHYDYTQKDRKGDGDKINWNTLRTPKGGRYSMTLSDGTKVWLNAESSIRFPDRFSRDMRHVSVSGEVYFDVAHDSSSSFTVRTTGMAIRVLGTSFNVSSYDEPSGKASVALLEGSVKLHTDAESVILSPGEKVKITKEGLRTASFDVESEIAWKDNYFVFKDQNIKSIMGTLARWYDAEVDYQGTDWDTKNFTIRISRREQIGEILSLIELTKSVRFDIKGRRITVTEI